MFSKSYELSLNKNYVSHWGLIEAIRELIQNAIDSDSPFVYAFERQPDGKNRLVLNSEFTELTPQSLLLGTTSKADATDKIGSFGEGYKIALLVLTRIGNKVDILNGKLLWQPVFKHSSKFNEELLVIEESAAPSKNKGLTFVIYDLTEWDIEQIRESCLRMQDHIGAIKSTSKGHILLEKPGKLYVGGLFICDTELTYGYDIKPEFIRLERDRQTVDSWNLKSLSRDMWYETKEFDRIAKMIDEEIPDLEYAQYDSPEMVKDACYRYFQTKHPGAIAVSSQQELDELVKKGMTNTVYANRGSYAQISRSSHYSTAHISPVVQPEVILKKFLTDNKSKMQASAIVNFKALIAGADKWTIR